MMGSLRMFVAGGLLLIFIAVGTNGQLLTEKIPLGEVFLWKFSFLATFFRRRQAQS